MSATTFTPDESRRYFAGRLGKLRRAGNELAACCKFHHPDKHPSLRVNLEKGTWFCDVCNIGGGILDLEKKLTGKSDRECWTAINATIGREDHSANRAKRKIKIIYDYTDSMGKLLYQNVRYDPKGFAQRQPDGKEGWTWNMKGVTRVLFNLPIVLRSNVVLIAEGEKDAGGLQKASREFPNDNGKLLRHQLSTAPLAAKLKVKNTLDFEHSMRQLKVASIQEVGGPVFGNPTGTTS